MSIILREVTKEYPTRHGSNRILKNVSLRVEQGERVGILGQNGAGKSTLIRVLSGAERPTSGTVVRDMSVSWPLAFGGAFLGALTGVDNVRFVCRLYGVDPEDKLPFVEEFTELGRYLREPVKSYSSGMRARLAFATSMAIDFDCYLIDEIVAVGDDRFQRKCEEELFDKRGDRAMLIVSHSGTYVSRHCQRASVLAAGTLTNFEDVEGAYQFYASHEMAVQPHMALLEATKVSEYVPVDLNAQALDEVANHDAQQGTSTLEALLKTRRVASATPFDACDFVGSLLRRGHVTTAKAVAEYLTRECPGEPLYFVTLGDILCSRRQHVGAVDAYKAALELDPQHYWANRNLAVELYNAGRYRDAVPFFQKAVEESPTDSARVEMQLRVIDCLTWLDEPVQMTHVQLLSAQPIHVMARSCAMMEDGSSVRISIAGVARTSINLSGLRCAAQIQKETLELKSALAPGSIRRLAAVADIQAFGYTVYATISPEVEDLTVELSLSGLPIAHEQISCRRVSGSLQAGEGFLEAARRTHALHQSEASAFFYGRAAEQGAKVDIVPFVENLIAVGLYDEAEQRLLDWVDGPSFGEATADAGPVLDLLCVELARSRLPGWRQLIAGAIERVGAASSISSALANLGHACANDNRLLDAVRLYQDAVTSSDGDQLIHFARGVRTAQYADQVPGVRISESMSLSPADYDIVHLFACDAKYFMRFAEVLTTSSKAAADGTRLQVHAHIVDPDSESLALAHRLNAEHNLRFSTGKSPPPITADSVRRAYFTCARFLEAPRLLREYGCPILITETDALINWSWRDIITHVGRADVGCVQSALWNWVPWTKVPAGIIYLSQSCHGQAWAAYVARFLRYAFERQGEGTADVWTVDQVALWLSHVMAPEGTCTVHLPMNSVLTLATGDKTDIVPTV